VSVYNIPTLRAGRLAGRLLGVLFFVLLWREAAAAPPAVRSFEGDRGPGIDVCTSKTPPPHCDRPEMSVAVNGQQIVQATWRNLSVYDHEGRLLSSTPMVDLIRAAGLDPVPHGVQGPFEPHIVFNEFIARWVMTVTCANDCLLVSASSDPTGPWGGTYLSCLQGGPCLDHDPSIHLGYDRNGVYVCEGHIGDDNPATVPTVAFDCFAVPTAEVKAIAQRTPPAHINRVHNMPLDVIPAIDHNPSKAPTAPAFFANKSCEHTKPYACQRSDNYAFNWVVNTFTWQGATGTYNAGGAQQMVATDVGSKTNKWFYNSPCCGETMSVPQAGSDVTLRVSASHRLLNVFQHDSHLHGVLGTGPCTGASCGEQGADAHNIMIWAELDCSHPKCVVSQTAKIADPDRHLLFGTVGVDRAGNVGIVASTAAANENLGVALWTRRRDDPPNTFGAAQRITPGTKPYTCLNARNMVSLSNSVGLLTALDPADASRLWTNQQYANDAAPCVWNTRIVGYQIDASGKSPAKAKRP
jgi:hypothetical protein